MYVYVRCHQFSMRVLLKMRMNSGKCLWFYYQICLLWLLINILCIRLRMLFGIYNETATFALCFFYLFTIFTWICELQLHFKCQKRTGFSLVANILMLHAISGDSMWLLGLRTDGMTTTMRYACESIGNCSPEQQNDTIMIRIFCAGDQKKNPRVKNGK